MYQIYTHDFEINDEKRRVRVYVPDTQQKCLPVIYMLDGQNVFYDEEAFDHYSWKVLATASEKDFPKVVIVAIDNAATYRNDEYSMFPYENFKSEMIKKDAANQFVSFVVQTLKPFIENHYHVSKLAEDTVLIGSSLGACMTQYIGHLYPHLFGNLGVFSTASFIFQSQFDQFLQKIPIMNQTVYIHVGTKEGDVTEQQLVVGDLSTHYLEASQNYAHFLKEKGIDVSFNIVIDGTHHEKTWSKSFKDCVMFFSQKWKNRE